MGRGIVAVLALAYGGVSTAGCVPMGSDEASSALSTSWDTVAGVEFVRSTGTPPTWTLDTLLNLGSVASPNGVPADDEFAWVSSVALGPNHELYVADLGTSEIRVFDLQGDLRRTIGREGSGPGEFEAIYSIQWLGDTLVTLDHENGRVGSFSPMGAWLHSEPFVGRLTDSPVTTRLYAAGSHELYVPAYRAADQVVQPIWRRYDPARLTEEWPRRSLPVVVSFLDKVVCTMGRGFSWFDHPYAARSLEHPAPGRQLYLATTDKYAIVLLNVDGDTVRIIERDAEMPTLNEQEWNRVHGRFEEWLEGKDRSQCRPPNLARPDNKPPIEGLMVDIPGRLWVEANAAEGTRWEVFDRDGRLIGSVNGFAHDRQRTVPWIGENYIAWVSRDELDVAHVYVASINR